MVEPLGIPFVVVVRDELAAGATPRALADQDQALEAGVLDGAHEARRVGVQVRRAGGALDGGDIGWGERVAPGRPEARVAVMDEDPDVSQASVLGSGGVPHDGHCQVDEKIVDRPPRYWAPARREPAMLGIKNGRQPQLDNTRWGTYAYAAAARLGGDAALGGAAPDADRRRSAAGVAGARPLWDRHPS